MGHLVLFSGLFACFVILILKEMANPANRGSLNTEEGMMVIILGSGFGVVLGLYLIEATYFIIPALIWSLGFLIIMGRKLKSLDQANHIYSNILWYSHLAIILVALVYLLIFGSFTPPSEIFGF